MISNELEQTAKKLGQDLRNMPEVVAYLQAAQAVQENAEAVALEEKFLTLYQQLVAQEQAGQALDKNQLTEYYQLREQVRFHPLIAAREEQLQMAKLIFADVGQILTSALGIDFSALAL
jgi:cell fate (sporulation/competence/biofilm development) regulator YlbF (YheA/YmcA/DUF963 family)